MSGRDSGTHSEPPGPTPLEKMLGEGVRADTAPITDETHDLFEEERIQVVHAVPKRQREWAAGRRLARRLLSELGFSPRPLLAGRDRAPRWPEGVVGSIAHTRDLCAVAVARAEAVRSLGIDVEDRAALEPKLWPSVLTPREQARLRHHPEATRGLWAMVLFSAKEALYKAQYRITRTMVDFPDADITLFPDDGRFEARIEYPCSARLSQPLAGRFTVGVRILTAVRVEHGT